MKISDVSDKATRIHRTASAPATTHAHRTHEDAPVRHPDAVDITPRTTEGNLVTPYLGGTQAEVAVEKTLESAKTSIHVEMYRLGYDKIIDVLARQARAGVKVQVLLDPTPGYNPKDAKDQSSIRQFLEKSGVEILKYPIEKSGKIDHVKLLVVDGKSAVIGGLNWDTHSHFNTDMNVTIQGPAVEDLDKVFANDWHIAGGHNTPRAQAVDNPKHDKGDAEVRMLTTDIGREDIRHAVVKDIHGAKHSIRMFAFALADKEVVDGLIDAHKRGVNVKVLLEPGKPMGYVNEKTRKTLVDAGIDARFLKVDLDTEEKLHAKAVVFDDDKAILGSANFTNKGLTVNHEASIEVISKSVGPAMSKFFDNLWEDRSLKKLPDLPDLEQRATTESYGESVAHTLYSWFNDSYHADNKHSWVGGRKLAVLEAMKDAGSDPKAPKSTVEAEQIGHMAAFLAERKIWDIQPKPNSDEKVWKTRVEIAAKAEKELPARIPELKSQMQGMIADKELRNLLTTVLEHAPDGFYKSPSSSSGKFHPADEDRLVDVQPHMVDPTAEQLASYPGGGLVLHSRRNMEVAKHLCDYFGIEGKERDEILVAEALHDIMKFVSMKDFKSWKPGQPIPWGNYTTPEHAHVGAEFIKKLDPTGGTLTKNVCHYVDMHMGAWNAPKPTPPQNKAEAIISLSDYLAGQDDYYVKV